MVRRPTRREFLRAGLASGGVLVAGCSGGDSSDDGTDTGTPTPDETSTGDGETSPTPDDRGADDQGSDDQESGDTSEDAVQGDPVWPMARATPAGTGAHPGAVGPGEQPEVTWETPLDGEVVTAPVADESTVYVATAANTLFAISAADGSVQWSKALDGAPEAPALGEQRLFVPHAGISAFDPENGTELWYHEDGQTASTPALYANETVYAGVDRGVGDDVVLAVNQGGGLAWTQSNLSVGTTTPKPTALATSGGELFVATDGPGVVVLGLARGSRQRLVDAGPTPGFAVDDVVVAYGGRDAGFRERTGESRTFRLQNEVGAVDDATAPLVTDDYVVWGTDTGVNAETQGIMGLSKETGRLRWTEGVVPEVSYPPVASRDHIYGNSTKWVYCTSNIGAGVWKTRLDGSITTQLAVSNGNLYLGLERDGEHHVAALGTG